MKILILALLMACSTTYKPVKVNSFVNNWVEDYDVKDLKIIENYRIYLTLVEEEFSTQDKMHAFDGYLTSVNNAHQLITHTEFMLPQRYRLENGRHRPINTPKYEQYRGNKLREVRRRLDKEREEKFLSQLGIRSVEKIKKNYNLLKGELFQFPL